MLPDGNYIRPERIKEWRKILYRAQNFFKHADDDSTDTLFFAPQMTQSLMLEACERYQMHARERRPLMKLFIFGSACTNRAFFGHTFSNSGQTTI
jgi:hypothetical protein